MVKESPWYCDGKFTELCITILLQIFCNPDEKFLRGVQVGELNLLKNSYENRIF